MLMKKPLLSTKRTIAFIAPSGLLTDQRRIDRAASYFDNHGWNVSAQEQCWAQHERFAGTDDQRVEAIEQVVADRNIDFVMAIRGGYGMTRLLHRINWKRVAKSEKQFMGFSDFTGFNLALLAQTGAPSWQGPMASSDFGGETINSFTEEHFLTAIESKQYTLKIKATRQPKIDVKGMLWGGNLAMIATLLGTPYFPQVKGGILFLEDIGEHPYRIERMLWQLHYSGVLAKQKAIILGDFTDYKLAPSDNGYNFDTMLQAMRKIIKTPILTGLKFGHNDEKVTLAVGAGARVESVRGGYQLEITP
jgi:muramoyltetrapeptide carboxypeptidase